MDRLNALLIQFNVGEALAELWNWLAVCKLLPVDLRLSQVKQIAKCLRFLPTFHPNLQHETRLILDEPLQQAVIQQIRDVPHFFRILLADYLATLNTLSSLEIRQLLAESIDKERSLLLSTDVLFSRDISHLLIFGWSRNADLLTLMDSRSVNLIEHIVSRFLVAAEK